MNGLFIQNRQIETAKGAGFPFYTKREYQYRFQNRSEGTFLGFWQVPNNQVPTFQLWSSGAIDRIDLVQVSGLSDVATEEINLSNLNKTCTTDPFEIYDFGADDLLDINIECGAYYLRLYNSGDPSIADFYSEVFEVGAPFWAVAEAAVTQSTGPTSGEITVSLKASHEISIGSYEIFAPAGPVGVGPIPGPSFTTTFAFTIPNFSSGKIEFKTVLNFDPPILFTDVYTLTNNSGTFTLTKNYMP